MSLTAMTSALALCLLVASLGSLSAESSGSPLIAEDDEDTVVMDTTQAMSCVWIKSEDPNRQIEITFGIVNIESGRDLATGMCDLANDRLLFVDRPNNGSYVLLELCEKNKKPLSIISSGPELKVCYLHRNTKNNAVAFEYALTELCDGFAKIVYTERSPGWIHSPYVETTGFIKTAYPDNLKFQHEIRPSGSSGIEYWFSKWGMGANAGVCRDAELFVSNPESNGRTGEKRGFCGSEEPNFKICHFGNVIFYEMDINGNGANKGYVGEWRKCEMCGSEKCTTAGPPTPATFTTTSTSTTSTTTTTTPTTTTAAPVPPTCPESCLTDMYKLEFPSPYYGIKTEEYDYDAVEAYLTGLGCGEFTREDINGVDTIKFNFQFDNCPSLKPTLDANTGDLVFALNIKFNPDYQNCQDCDGTDCGYRIYTKNTLTYSVVCNVRNPTLPPNLVDIGPTVIDIGLEEKLTPTFEKCLCDCEDCSNCRNNIVAEGFNLEFQTHDCHCNYWKFCAVQTNPNIPADFFIRAKQIYSYRSGPLDYRILFFRNNIVEMSGNAAKLNAEVSYEHGLVCFRLLPFCYPKLATAADSTDRVNIRMDLILCDDANTGNDLSCTRDPEFCYRKTPRDCTSPVTQGRSIDILTGEYKKKEVKVYSEDFGLQTECSAHSQPKCGAWPVIGN